LCSSATDAEIFDVAKLGLDLQVTEMGMEEKGGKKERKGRD
jgi:hypothetical protein